MIANGNEYCMAAFEVWRNDENLEDLEDTLKRCAKLEHRKLMAAVLERQRRDQISAAAGSYVEICRDM